MDYKLRPMRCAKDTFKYLGARFWSLGEWAVPSMSLQVLVLILFKLPPYDSSSRLFLIYLPVSIVLNAPISMKAQREKLLGELEVQRYWKYFITRRYLIYLGFLFVMLAIIALPWFILSFSLAFLLKFSFTWIASVIMVVMAIGAFILTFFLAMRLNLVLPMVAIETSKPFRISWLLTKGRVVRILGATTLAFLPFIIAQEVFRHIFHGIGELNELSLRYALGMLGPCVIYVFYGTAFLLVSSALTSIILEELSNATGTQIGKNPMV